MFLGVAVGEAESGRLAVESTQGIYPSIVYPGSETPAAVIIVEVGVLEFAFDKDILKTGVRDLVQPLGKVLVAGLRPGMKSFPGSRQNIRDDVAAIHPLVLREPRLIPVITGAVVHLVVVYVGIEGPSFDATNAILKQRDVGNIRAGCIYGGQGPHWTIQIRHIDMSPDEPAIVVVGVHRIGQYQGPLVGQAIRTTRQFLGGPEGGHQNGH